MVEKEKHPNNKRWDLLAMWETRVQSLGQKIPWKREWQPTPVFLPGESPGWRSLAGSRTWGRKELDVTEWLTHTHTHTHTHNKRWRSRRREWVGEKICVGREPVRVANHSDHMMLISCTSRMLQDATWLCQPCASSPCLEMFVSPLIGTCTRGIVWEKTQPPLPANHQHDSSA